MKKLLLFAFLLCASFAASQTTSTLASGGIGVSCNALTASTSTNPGLTGGCTSFALLTSGGSIPNSYTWAVVTTGSPASVTVNLVGSLDNVSWSQIDTTTAAGSRSSSGSYRFLGCVPTTLTGGASPTVTCQISVSIGGGGAGGSSAFNAITSGTNTTAAMVVGSGSSLAISGTGTIAATSVPWSAILGGSGNLAISPGGTSVFNTTSALSQFFAWKNTTAAVVGTSQGSPVLSDCGTGFHAGASVEICATNSILPGNGNDAAITVSHAVTGSSTGQVTDTFSGSVQAGNPGGVGGTLVLPEGTAASAVASDEVIYGDSTLHLAKVSNNNGTFEALQATSAAPGSSTTLPAGSAFFSCTTTCTITVPMPPINGIVPNQYCIRNGNNVATVITLAALGSSGLYENTARTAYGTAGTGTFVSGGAVKDFVCIVGLDATHYSTVSSNGTWTAN